MSEVIKVYTPILPIGSGPICEKIEDAMFDIIEHIAETTDRSLSDEAVERLAMKVIKQHDLQKINLGMIPIAYECHLMVNLMPRDEFEALPEFMGY
ncbi:hypothetical protein_gp046 [Bacillus phage vB_BceM_WH1]|nr:hypothetical protein_gp046 [Bacillus phage vB_BceM_WH1]